MQIDHVPEHDIFAFDCVVNFIHLILCTAAAC